jgi:hypothetical protein
MSATRTKGRYDSDLGYSDGQIFISVADATELSPGSTTGGAPLITKNAVGDYSLNITGATTPQVNLLFPLSGIIFRYGLQDDSQQQFGSQAAGGAQGLTVAGTTTITTASTVASNVVNVPVVNSANFVIGRRVKYGVNTCLITAIPDATHITLSGIQLGLIIPAVTFPAVITESLFTTPADVTGPPPYPGTTQFVPVTTPRPKGITIKQIYPVYEITVAPISAQTIGVTKTVIAPASGVVPVVTNLLTNAANGLQVAMSLPSGTPIVTPIQMPNPVQITYQNSKYASYNIEWDITGVSGSIQRVYGVWVDVTYNYC